MELKVAKQSTRFFLDNRDANSSDSFIMLFGGEPLCNWSTCKSYITWAREYLAGRPIDLCVFTNGLFFNEQITGFLIEHDIATIVSINGNYEQHNRSRPVTKEAYDNVIREVRRLNAHGRVQPYCVLSRVDLASAEQILADVAGIGPKVVNVARDFNEIWSSGEKTTLLGALRRVNAKTGVVFRVYPEEISDCDTCHPRSIMVYPDGAIYDLCLLCATVQAERAKTNLEYRNVLYCGNVATCGSIKMDIAEKRRCIRSITTCRSLPDTLQVSGDHLRVK